MENKKFVSASLGKKCLSVSPFVTAMSLSDFSILRSRICLVTPRSSLR